MYTQINSEKIELDFNNGVSCKITGPDNHYYVQVSEYVNGNDLPIYVEGYGVSERIDGKLKFTLPIEFYMDFEISITKFVDKIGLVKIFSHRFCDYGQYTKFILNTKNYEEVNIWSEKVLDYQKKTGCKVLLESHFESINKKFESHYQSKQIKPYKTYRLGRFPKSSTDFRTTDERCEGLIWFGHWKKFWSYQHPRSWNGLNSIEIAQDILGL